MLDVTRIPRARASEHAEAAPSERVIGRATAHPCAVYAKARLPSCVRGWFRAKGSLPLAVCGGCVCSTAASAASEVAAGMGASGSCASSEHGYGLAFDNYPSGPEPGTGGLQRTISTRMLVRRVLRQRAQESTFYRVPVTPEHRSCQLTASCRMVRRVSWQRSSASSARQCSLWQTAAARRAGDYRKALPCQALYCMDMDKRSMRM